jgi:BirA family biotin operon repressor/biotin-[acetyl-CoA-carboxylase] ligase
VAEGGGDGVPLAARVFAALADGQVHSGEGLAHSLGVTRSAVWKAAEMLRELGVSLDAARNRGYSMHCAVAPLDAGSIRAALPTGTRERVSTLEVEWCMESTNGALAARGYPVAGESQVLLAEFQTAGRGRRGRKWLAPPGGSICLSLSWTFRQLPRDVGALSLAIGVCVLRALRARGLEGARLKWPNDVLVGDAKLGGILIELRAESAGPACVVVGIGLNMALGEGLLDTIAAQGLPATDLASAGVNPAERNAVAACLIDCCLRGLQEFELEGLRPFIDEWRHADALSGREISVRGGDEGARGLARGINLAGALLVETPGGLRTYLSGDVTVRPVA